MKDLKFICAQPDDNYYIWQVHLWLESLRKIGHSEKAIVLIFTPHKRQLNQGWKKIVDLYPESEFVFYNDELNEITQKLTVYIPILRPFCLRAYFRDNLEMENKAVFYCDSDVLFTEKFNIDSLIEDDVCYLSDTNSYINASYFDSKMKDVLPDKLLEYCKVDVLGQLSSYVGISKEICIENNLHSGGAQYLLKNVDWKFWDKIIQDCLVIRMFLMRVNELYFESEDRGFQSWCADMWAVLWNLWYRKQETKVVPELNFAWATEPIQKLKTCSIYHNAGITSENMGGYPAFYKGKYHTGKDPFADEQLQIVFENENSKKYCMHYYVEQLIELKNNYNLNY